MSPGWVRFKAVNFPVGWEIGFDGITDSTGAAISLPRTLLTTWNVTNAIMVGGTFNAGWTSNVNYYIWENGIPPPQPPIIYTSTLDLVTITWSSGGGNATVPDFAQDLKVIVVKPSMEPYIVSHNTVTLTKQ